MGILAGVQPVDQQFPERQTGSRHVAGRIPGQEVFDSGFGVLRMKGGTREEKTGI